jgi:hypothetical protein
MMDSGFPPGHRCAGEMPVYFPDLTEAELALIREDRRSSAYECEAAGTELARRLRCYEPASATDREANANVLAHALIARVRESARDQPSGQGAC